MRLEKYADWSGHCGFAFGSTRQNTPRDDPYAGCPSRCDPQRAAGVTAFLAEERRPGWVPQGLWPRKHEHDTSPQGATTGNGHVASPSLAGVRPRHAAALLLSPRLLSPSLVLHAPDQAREMLGTKTCPSALVVLEAALGRYTLWDVETTLAKSVRLRGGGVWATCVGQGRCRESVRPGRARPPTRCGP